MFSIRCSHECAAPSPRTTHIGAEVAWACFCIHILDIASIKSTWSLLKPFIRTNLYFTIICRVESTVRACPHGSLSTLERPPSTFHFNTFIYDSLLFSMQMYDFLFNTRETTDKKEVLRYQEQYYSGQLFCFLHKKCITLHGMWMQMHFSINH